MQDRKAVLKNLQSEYKEVIPSEIFMKDRSVGLRDVGLNIVQLLQQVGIGQLTFYTYTFFTSCLRKITLKKLLIYYSQIRKGKITLSFPALPRETLSSGELAN